MMKRLFIALILVSVAWHVHRTQRAHDALELAREQAAQRLAERKASSRQAAEEWRPASFRSAQSAPSRCDGRTQCPQMTSCEEARYFLAHCPGTQMDGDRDGNPCEQQWCGR